MPATPSIYLRRAGGALLLLACTFPVGEVGAQGRTTGAITGRMQDERGMAVADAALTFTRDGRTVLIATTALDGSFKVDELRPGSYALLAEQFGYQPVRIRGIHVVAGERLVLSIDVVRRPPPITAVEERRHTGTGGGAGGGVAVGESIEMLAGQFHATDLTSGVSFATREADARPGALLGTNGLPGGQARLRVDGVEALMLRHPGLPTESGAAPAFAREGIDQFRFDRFTLDNSLLASTAGVIDLVSRTGDPGTRFTPFGSWSGSSLGSPADDNPADSSASSWRAGVTGSGAARGDTMSWAFHLDYRQEAVPGALPFSREGTAEAIGDAAGGRNVSRWTAPTVRRWTGGTGGGALRVPLGRQGRLSARIAVASWEEESPLAGRTLANGAGVTLNGSDVSAAVIAEFWGEEWRSITRLGVQDASREWLAAGVPYTTLATEGAAIGVAPATPGDFAERLFTIEQELVVPTGDHRLSAGATAGLRRATYDWLPGRFGHAAFGGADAFAAGEGSWAIADASGGAEELSVPEVAFFVQDAWRVVPGLELSFGLRFETQFLPDDVVTADPDVAAALGLVTNLVPTDRSSALGPRLGVRWDPGRRGRTLVHFGAGLVPGRYDLAALAEVARHDGDVTVRRATGAIGWPDGPAGAQDAKAITFFDSDVRAPRAIQVSAGVAHAIAPGTVVSVTGGFQHTDYLLRRDDVNLSPAPLAFTDEGRPVWGELVQFGGLIVPAAGSNQRVAGLDHVWGLASTGYAEQQYATVSLERRAAEGLMLSASYTWSHAEDNLPGMLSADPADRALILDTNAPALWGDDRSDLDVPHRLVIAARYRSPGPTALTLAARWRWRSGLPFTPGFPPGVDVNGDGSSANDPVSLRTVESVGGLLRAAGCEVGNGVFAARNSCREQAVQALDASATIRVRIGGAHGVRLSVEAFNLVASATGVVDRAAVLVDPDGAMTTDNQGRLVLPLVANDHFGQLLSRRTAPRTIRFGLRLGL